MERLLTDWGAVAKDFMNEFRGGLNVAAGEIFGTDGNILDVLINSINTHLPLMLEQGVQTITSFANGILANIPMLLEVAGGIVDTVYTCIFENAPKIWESGVDLILNLVNGITENLPAIANSAVGIVDKLLNTIFENAPQMLESGVTLLEKLVKGIIDSLPKLISAAADLVVNLLKTVLKYAPKLIEGGLTLLGQLAAGLIRAIPTLIGKIPEIIKSIKDKFSSIDWGEVGKNILSGIAKGIKNFASTVIDAAKDAAKSALNGIKSILGIHSPSRVFENEVGKMIDLGLAAGIKDNISTVIDSIKTLSKATIGTMDADFAYSMNGNYDVNNFARSREQQTIVIHNHVDMDGREVARNTVEYIGEQLMWEVI